MWAHTHYQMDTNHVHVHVSLYSQLRYRGRAGYAQLSSHGEKPHLSYSRRSLRLLHACAVKLQRYVGVTTRRPKCEVNTSRGCDELSHLNPKISRLASPCALDTNKWSFRGKELVNALWSNVFPTHLLSAPLHCDVW